MKLMIKLSSAWNIVEIYDQEHTVWKFITYVYVVINCVY